MKIAGIDIDKDVIRVVELNKKIRDISVSGCFKVPVKNGNLPEALKDVLKGIPDAEIITSVEGRHVSFRSVRLPITDVKKIEKAIPFEAEELLPFPPDELILDYQIIERTDKDIAVALVAVKKERITAHLDALGACGIDPKAIDITASAISAVVSRYLKDENGCYAVVYIGSDDADIGVFKEREPRFFRNIPLREGWERDVCNTLYTYQAVHKEDLSAFYLCGSKEKGGLLKREINTIYNKELLEIDLKKDQNIKIKEGDGYAKALGLALREANGKSFKVNLRKGEFAYKKEETELRKKLKYTVALAAIALLLLLINFSVKYYTVESRYAGIAREIRKNFKDALPEVKNIVNEEQQLKTAVAEAKKKLRLLGGRIEGDITALDLFKEVTEKMPAEHKVALFEFNLEGDKIRLFGEAASFEAADKIKESLLKSDIFKEVAISDAKIGAEQNKVKFRINITLKEAI